MAEWPPIEDPELVERLAMDDGEFRAYMESLVSALPAREFEAKLLARAVEYPWARPKGSYRMVDGMVEPLDRLAVEARREMIQEFAAPRTWRRPLVAIGSNGSPEALERKFAHFEDPADQTVLVLTGHLHGFDVGAAAQPTIYGALPATIFPSPGTEVRAALLWVTPDQFTQLAWSEISYRLGTLRTRFEVDEGDAVFDEVLVFVSRFGTFAREGEPLALKAVPAKGRKTQALEQEELLDLAASLALGEEATASTLVRGIFEDLAATMEVAEAVRRSSIPFASELWEPFDSSSGS